MMGYNSFKEMFGKVISNFAKAIYHSIQGEIIKLNAKALAEIQPINGRHPATNKLLCLASAILTSICFSFSLASISARVRCAIFFSSSVS